MESRVELAVQNKKQGMNCAQAVACAFCDLANADVDTMAAVTQGFGGGIGGSLEGTCGAIIGACTVIGLANRNGERSQTMKACKQILTQFNERSGSVICKELKGIGTGKVLRSCDDCVRDAAEFLEKSLTDL